MEKKSYRNNKSKISAPTLNEEFELPGNQDYFECLKKSWKKN